MKNNVLRKKIHFLLPIAILLVLSLLNMYGAKSISPLYQSAFKRQAVWILIGVTSMFLVSKINMNFLLKYSGLFYLVGCIFLGLVLKFGTTVNGATSWFKIGRLSFQPSELFKFFYLIYIAKIIKENKRSGLLLFIKILILSIIPSLLIFLEPDTGVVIMYILMMFGLIFSSPVEKRYPIMLIGTGVVALVAFFGLYFMNGDLFTKIFGVSFFYRMDRILSFKNASSYQLSNALIGIGASGLWGFGLKDKKMYIPEVTTDFVFDLTICNFGYLMGIIVVVIYAYILLKIYKTLSMTKAPVDRAILSGTFYMMSFQVVEHISMNLGLTPITGITLPFLSYGGSSLLSYFLIFGLILRIIGNDNSQKRKNY